MLFKISGTKTKLLMASNKKLLSSGVSQQYEFPLIHILFWCKFNNNNSSLKIKVKQLKKFELDFFFFNIDKDLDSTVFTDQLFGNCYIQQNYLFDFCNDDFIFSIFKQYNLEN
jgi:hypothetical protein